MEKLPFLDSQLELFIIFFLSHLGDVDSTERGRARGNTFLESNFIVGSINFLRYV